MAIIATASNANSSMCRLTQPLTTQPKIEISNEVLMCSTLFSTASTVLITSKPWRAQEGQEIIFTPRLLKPSDFKMW